MRRPKPKTSQSQPTTAMMLRISHIMFLVACTCTSKTSAFLADYSKTAITTPDRFVRSSDSRPTTTSHSLVPFSVATAVDPWAFPWTIPVSSSSTTPESGDYYTSSSSSSSSLQQQQSSTATSAPWSRRRRLVFPNVPLADKNYSNNPLIPITLRPRSNAQRRQQFRVYCDLDGVLVDFCHGIRTLFPHHQLEASQSVDALHRPTMWQKVEQAQPAFFAHLPWMPDGQRLWQAIRPLQPDILTGVPYLVSKSSRQKFDWCRRELGVPVQHIDKAFGRTPRQQQQQSSSSSSSDDDEKEAKVCRVITTWSAHKHVESGPGAVLIDDRLELKPDWEAAGGIFIHHLPGKVDYTLAQLRHHGVLPCDI